MIEIQKKWYTREECAAQPHKLFLFGDNFEDAKTGYVPRSTQAVIRGLPNAIGICTKISRRKHFIAEDIHAFLFHLQQVSLEIREAMKHHEVLVWPADGIGTGKANLKRHCPRALAHLEDFFEFLGFRYGPVKGEDHE